MDETERPGTRDTGEAAGSPAPRVDLARHRPARWPGRLVVGLATAGALLAGLEGLSRWLAPVPGRPDPLITEEARDWNNVRVSDQLLFWKLRPNVTRRNVTTNALGLRDQEVAAEKGNEFRVLSLGESTTYGTKVEAEETYSSLLEASIGTVGGRELVVINAGVPGYSLVQADTYLRRHGLQLEPDAVLLYFGFNDFLPVAYLRHRDARAAQAQPKDDWSLLQERLRPSSRLADWLHARSNAFRLLSSWVGGHVSDEGLRERTEVAKRLRRVPEERRSLLLQGMRELCAERGILLTIIVPWYRTFDKHEPLLRAFAAREGVSIVDLPVRLAEIWDRTEYFLDDVHPNPRGHQRIAAEIEKVVRPLWEAD